MKTNRAVSLAAIFLVVAWTWSSGGQPLGGPPGGGRGLPGMPGMPEFTQEQQAAIRALDQASAAQDRAVTEARNALNAAIFSEKPDTRDIKEKADKLAAAELTRALARAEAFSKLQSSPNKLDLPAPALTTLLDRGERGGPGGFGPPPGLPPGGFGGPGAPGGLNGPPGGPEGIGAEVQGSSELPFVSPMFGDNMVLQRGKPARIWGWSKPGEEIRVAVANHTAKAVTKSDGRWSVVIEPPAPGGPYTVVIDGPQHVEFHEVLVGDVWLCGGQSNMEMGLGRVRNGSNEIAAADHPGIRLFVVRQRGAKAPAAVPQGSWKVCSPKTIGEGSWGGFSAVAYFFGLRLQQDLDVPIGLVEDCFGGTPAEAWTTAETLRTLGISDTGAGPNTPAVLYNGMIAPVTPLAISGAIWYQGESNTERAEQYRKLLPAMINDWRRAFGQGDFPFYIVSLAAHKQHKETPGDDSWAELRAAQDFVAHTVTNSGLALAIDVGDAMDVHPKDKKEVGERFAAVALARHYGKDIPYSGPRFASAKTLPGALKLSFTHTDGGLMVKGDKLEEFSICGEDRKWHWAEARIEGDSVVVSSSEVSNPAAARYAWQANPKATLFNGAGLPAIPFGTDDAGGTNHNHKLGGKE
ncbi:MAG: sialate O-acetylesterase [Limisphaerales bacterium]